MDNKANTDNVIGTVHMKPTVVRIGPIDERHTFDVVIPLWARAGGMVDCLSQDGSQVITVHRQAILGTVESMHRRIQL